MVAVGLFQADELHRFDIVVLGIVHRIGNEPPIERANEVAHGGRDVALGYKADFFGD